MVPCTIISTNKIPLWSNKISMIFLTEKFAKNYLAISYGSTSLIDLLVYVYLWNPSLPACNNFIQKEKHHLQCYNAQERLKLTSSIMSYAVLKEVYVPTGQKKTMPVWRYCEYFDDELNGRSEETNQKALKCWIAGSLEIYCRFLKLVQSLIPVCQPLLCHHEHWTSSPHKYTTQHHSHSVHSLIFAKLLMDFNLFIVSGNQEIYYWVYFSIMSHILNGCYLINKSNGSSFDHYQIHTENHYIAMLPWFCKPISHLLC